MKKRELYIDKLKELNEWEAYLLQESGLPGKRANLELAEAVATIGDEKIFQYYISFDSEKAPTDSQEEFLTLCGVMGIGKLLTEGKTLYVKTLRTFASDPRWRVREGVAMALQIYGEEYMAPLIDEMVKWSEGNVYEKRAAIAALCEPKLLKEKKNVKKVFEMLDDITKSLISIGNRKEEGFRVLRKGLAYCWSVAVVSYPEEGKRLMEKWFETDDKDIHWIMKENLKKNRLNKMDETWVQKWKVQLGVL